MIISSHKLAAIQHARPRRAGSSLRRTRAKTSFALRRKTHTRHDRLVRSSPNVDRPPLAIARALTGSTTPV